MQLCRVSRDRDDRPPPIVGSPELYEALNNAKTRQG